MVFAHVHLVGMELFVALVLRVIMDQIAPLVLIVVMEHAQMALLAVVLAFAVEIGPQGMASLVKHAYLDLPSQIVNVNFTIKNPLSFNDYLNQTINIPACTCQNGVCNQENGTCNYCNTGWTGVNCDSCSPGYYGANCTACVNCSQGICNDGLNSNGSCSCSTNWTTNGAGICNKCITDHALPNCQLCTCQNGICAQTQGTCLSCNTGWAGVNCDSCSSVLKNKKKKK
jgi:hypothetical protein